MREYGAAKGCNHRCGDSIQKGTFESRGGLTLLSRKMPTYVFVVRGSLASTSLTPHYSLFPIIINMSIYEIACMYVIIHYSLLGR